METLSTTENVILSIMALAIMGLLIPSAKIALERSKDVPKDWMGLLLPLGLVIAFVIFLIAMV
ncbi:MAG: hypothetical protein WAX77_05360 [Methylococcaceae bacterium]